MITLNTFLATVIYAGLGIVIFVLSFVLVDRLTPGELWKEIIERQNTAVALLAVINKMAALEIEPRMRPESGPQTIEPNYFCRRPIEIIGSEHVAHLDSFCLKIFRVVWIGFAADRHLLDHLNPVPLEADHFFRIVR